MKCNHRPERAVNVHVQRLVRIKFAHTTHWPNGLLSFVPRHIPHVHATQKNPKLVDPLKSLPTNAYLTVSGLYTNWHLNSLNLKRQDQKPAPHQRRDTIYPNCPARNLPRRMRRFCCEATVARCQNSRLSFVLMPNRINLKSAPEHG